MISVTRGFVTKLRNRNEGFKSKSETLVSFRGPYNEKITGILVEYKKLVT